MDTVLRLLFYEVLGLGLIATVVKSFSWRDRFQRTRNPLLGKLLRSPGQSLQDEVQTLNDWLMGLLAGIVATPAILLGQMPHTINGRAIAVMCVAVIAWAVPLIHLLGVRRNLELAVRGERAVAEEVNRLMLEGCQVFHDYPAGPNWNIDHIVVAPSGVYAIETKTRRKRAGVHGHEVTFDGSRLVFPRGFDTKALGQARRNSADLARELSALTAEPIIVNAVLTLPGWFVNRKGKSDVNVLNPQEIRQAVITNEKPLLSPAQLQRIGNHLDQKCRDVEL